MWRKRRTLVINTGGRLITIFFARQERVTPWQEEGIQLKVSCHPRSIVDRIENVDTAACLQQGLMYCMRMVCKWPAIVR